MNANVDLRLLKLSNQRNLDIWNAKARHVNRIVVDGGFDLTCEELSQKPQLYEDPKVKGIATVMAVSPTRIFNGTGSDITILEWWSEISFSLKITLRQVILVLTFAFAMFATAWCLIGTVSRMILPTTWQWSSSVMMSLSPPWTPKTAQHRLPGSNCRVQICANTGWIWKT